MYPCGFQKCLYVDDPVSCEQCDCYDQEWWDRYCAAERLRREARSLLEKIEASGLEKDPPQDDCGEIYWPADVWSEFLRIEEKFRKIFHGDYYRRAFISDGLRFIIAQMEVAK